MARQRTKKRKFASEKDLSNIERFAGSSEEEDNNNSSNAESESDDESDIEQTTSTSTADKNDKVDDEDAKDEAASHDEEDEDPVVIQTGMASVMNRLLSSRPVAGAPTAVLSKTKTKLQVQATQEENAEKDFQDRKKANREKKLAAMHVPLTGDKITEEVERERAHKRIATKGVVALFNAITQHQQPKETPAAAQQLSKKAKEQQNLTKDKFLEMIKKATASPGTRSTGASDTTVTSKNVQEKNSSKWEALRDDFKLDNMKNWDEESSEDEQMAAS